MSSLNRARVRAQQRRSARRFQPHPNVTPIAPDGTVEIEPMAQPSFWERVKMQVRGRFTFHCAWRNFAFVIGKVGNELCIALGPAACSLRLGSNVVHLR